VATGFFAVSLKALCFYGVVAESALPRLPQTCSGSRRICATIGMLMSSSAAISQCLRATVRSVRALLVFPGKGPTTIAGPVSRADLQRREWWQHTN
jgi:hypothetical protein